MVEKDDKSTDDREVHDRDGDVLDLRRYAFRLRRLETSGTMNDLPLTCRSNSKPSCEGSPLISSHHPSSSSKDIYTTSSASKVLVIGIIDYFRKYTWDKQVRIVQSPPPPPSPFLPILCFNPLPAAGALGQVVQYHVVRSQRAAHGCVTEAVQEALPRCHVQLLCANASQSARSCCSFPCMS